MRVLCLQEHLKNSITHLERIASKNQNTPVLGNVLFKTDGNELILFTTDLEIGLDVRIPCKAEKKGELTVPIKSLSYFIQNLPNSKIILEEKGKTLSIEVDDIHSVIPTTNKNEFPLLPKIETEQTITIKAKALKAALTQTLNSVAVSYSLPEISGILFDFKKETLKAVSTDSFRLSEKTIYQKDNYTIAKPLLFILPQRSAQELIRLIEKEEEDILISVDQNQAHFSFEGKNLSSRLIAGTYPNYEQIIPKSTKTKLHLNKTELSSKVKLASAFSSKLNDVKFSVNAKKGVLEITSQDEGRGSFFAAMQIEVSGEDVEATFNHRYLFDGLSNINEEQVLCELNGAAAPAIFSSEQGAYRYVVMPIKA